MNNFKMKFIFIYMMLAFFVSLSFSIPLSHLFEKEMEKFYSGFFLYLYTNLFLIGLTGITSTFMAFHYRKLILELFKN